MAKIYGLYLPYSQFEVVGIVDESKPKYPRGLARVRAYKTAQEQLDAYANTMCAASRTFEADSEEEFNRKVEEFHELYENEDWLKENVYPFL